MARLILPYQSVYDLNGDPISGAKMYFYESGTITPKDTYADDGLTVENTNPVIANSQGQFGPIFLSGNYSCQLTDSADVIQPDYPAEIEAASDTSSTVLLTGNQTIAGVKTFTDKLAVKSDEVIIELEENDASANNRITQLVADEEKFTLRFSNDSRDTFRDIFTVSSSGNNTQCNLTTSFSKGADIASAASLILGTDGNYFDVTGTVAVTGIGAVNVGTVIKLHFNESVLIENDPVNLILPGGQDLTTSAGSSEVEFVEYTTGGWRLTNYSAFISDATTVQTKVIEIGDWDMDSTSSVTIAHGLTYANIRTVQASIIHDDDPLTSILNGVQTGGGLGGDTTWDTNNINLSRVAGGNFDNSAYNATSFNRGWITIVYAI